jgi:alpha-beta hydrolase superfamily lysophospholipase
MLKMIRHLLRAVLYVTLGSLVGAIGLYIYLMKDRPDLQAWHTVRLDEEFTAYKLDAVRDFHDYLGLEERLFRQLEEKLYATTVQGPLHELNRYEKDSLADPTSKPVNWNRSFEMPQQDPRGGVLLLHGLSDSPYSLHALAKTLHEQGYYVLALRMPGHGTVPSGLVSATWQDMAAAVGLAAQHVTNQLDRQTPFHVFGYSMGAAQAVNYALDALEDEALRRPDSLVLISPAIGVSSLAALAVWQARLAAIPGLEKLAWNSIGPEYDPYKYTSFAINAGDQMYRLTLNIKQKFDRLEKTGGTAAFPRSLVFLSLVDATVSTHAVVTHLLDRADNKANELVLFDLNRIAQLEPFINHDPADAYRALLKRARLDFGLTYLTNASPVSKDIVMHKWSHGEHTRDAVPTGLHWPEQVYSLSHIALPFPATDDLYGSHPHNEEGLHIGMLASRGERGLLNVPASDMLRLRYNPFYDFMQTYILDFLADEAH